jgi:hypothetical protein
MIMLRSRVGTAEALRDMTKVYLCYDTRIDNYDMFSGYISKPIKRYLKCLK